MRSTLTRQRQPTMKTRHYNVSDKMHRRLVHLAVNFVLACIAVSMLAGAATL